MPEQPVLALGRGATSCNVNLLCPIRKDFQCKVINSGS